MKTEGSRFKTKGVLVCKVKLWNFFLQDVWTVRVYRHSKGDWICSSQRDLCLAGRALRCRGLPQTLGHLLLSLLSSPLATAEGISALG